MPTGSAQTHTGQTVVALLTDPGAPAELAERLSRELPRLFTRWLDDREWRVEIHDAPLAAGRHSPADILAAVRELRAGQGWDITLYLTELPLQAGGKPLVADLDSEYRCAVISLPALTGMWQYRRTRQAITRIVRAFTHAGAGRGRLRRLVGGRGVPFRRAMLDDGRVVRFVASPARGRARVLAGMVLSNRPWRLLPYMSKALAAALATSAIAMINGNIWLLSQALGGARLGVLAVFSIIVMVVWLIVHSDLWERPIDRSPQERERAALYNASTALTLAVGVFCGFVMLYVVDLMAVLFTIDGQVYAKVVDRPAHLGDYFSLAWMVASLATVGGALGSGFESDEAIRQAAYGERERWRRAERDRARQNKREESQDGR